MKFRAPLLSVSSPVYLFTIVNEMSINDETHTKKSNLFQELWKYDFIPCYIILIKIITFTVDF